MKTLGIALLSLALLSPLSAATETVAVTLDVTLSSLDYKSCDVALPVGSTAHDALDQAVEDGCISSWSGTHYDGIGTFVDCIDGVCGAVATFWAFSVDDAFSDKGIDDVVVADGTTLGFDYQQWVVPVA